MSKARSPSDRKPPLAELPSRLRCPTRILRSSVRSTKASSDSPVTKSQMVSRSWDLEESRTRLAEQSISCELRALAKMVEHEFGSNDFSTAVCPKPSVLFERGRFYDEYSARRNERLKRKKYGETEEVSRSSACGLGVALQSGKKRDTKKYDKLRKSVPANFSIGGTETNTPRYCLRSSTKAKENKPPTAPINAKRSVGDGDRKVAEVRRVRKS